MDDQDPANAGPFPRLPPVVRLTADLQTPPSWPATIDDLTALAQRQCGMNAGILLYIAGLLLVLLMPVLLPIIDILQTSLGEFEAKIALALYTVSFPMLIFLGIVASFLYGLPLAIRRFSPIEGVPLGLLILAPCLGVAVLLVIDRWARRLLEANGIRVGLLGPRWADLRARREACRASFAPGNASPPSSR